MSAGGCGTGCSPCRRLGPMTRASRSRRNCWRPRPQMAPRGVLAEVDELQREVEVLALDQGDHGLKIILLLGGDAQFLTLDLGPHALRALIADDLADLLGVL